MADSNIVVSDLIAQPGLGAVKLEWQVTDPNVNGLPYLGLDTVEVWASTVNDRASATKVAGGGAMLFTCPFSPGCLSSIGSARATSRVCSASGFHSGQIRV